MEEELEDLPPATPIDLTFVRKLETLVQARIAAEPVHPIFATAIHAAITARVKNEEAMLRLSIAKLGQDPDEVLGMRIAERAAWAARLGLRMATTSMTDGTLVSWMQSAAEVEPHFPMAFFRVAGGSYQAWIETGDE